LGIRQPVKEVCDGDERVGNWGIPTKVLQGQKKRVKKDECFKTNQRTLVFRVRPWANLETLLKWEELGEKKLVGSREKGEKGVAREGRNGSLQKTGKHVGSRSVNFFPGGGGKRVGT